MGGAKKVTVGYKYYVGMHMILCHGPVDRLLRIQVDERDVWLGSRSGGQITINRPDIFGGESREGGIQGTVDFETGHAGQGQNSYLLSKLGSYVPAFRGVAGMVLRQVYMGLNPYLKKWSFRLQRIHLRQNGLPQWYSSKAEIRASGLFKQTQSFLFALDVSGSMNTIVSGSTTRLDIAKAALIQILDDIDTLRKDSGVAMHVTVCLWANTQSSMTRNNVNSTGIDELKAYINGATAGGGTNFAGPFESASIFFSPFVQDGRRRCLFFITDGEPSPLSTLSDALSIGANILDRNASVAVRGTEVDVYVINIDLGDTQYSVQVDNTPEDGVPVVSSVDSSALYNAVFFAIMGDLSDMNPAHIIRECLTDPLWGMGYPDADIDDASFMAAADTLHAEGFGMSLLWDTETSIEEFIKIVVKHIDASVYVDRKSGKFVLKLIRNDYNPANLLMLNESNIEKITDFKRPSIGELINSVTVTYWDSETGQDATLTVQDIALSHQQQSTVGTSITYEGITNALIASRVAQRDLKTLSTPLASCTIYANRAAAGLDVGDVFKLTWPGYDLIDMVMRVTGIAYGDGRSHRVRVQCVQDVFAMPDSAVVVPPSTEWQDTGQEPVPITRYAVFEVPYFELVQQQGQQAADALLAGNPDMGFIGAGAARPQGAALSARIFTDMGNSYEDASNLDFCPYAVLDEAIDQMTTTFAIREAQDIENITLGTWFQLGTELMSVESITPSSITVKRGVLDTVPVPHADGDSLIFWDEYSDADPTEYIASEQINLKLLTVTGSGMLALADAPQDTVTLDSRAFRPYPPGDFKINNSYFPFAVSGPVSLSWVERNRVQQTGAVLIGFTDGTITPEDGMTYSVYAYNALTDELKYSETGITDLFHVIGVVDLAGITTLRVELYAVRDGYQSFQPQTHTMEWSSGENLMTFEDNYTPDDGDDVALQFTE